MMPTKNAPIWIVDPQHGKTLTAGLNGTIGNGQCVSTFMEGFDDYWENTTLWRAANIAPDGRALGYAETYYDYPNQRINLVRRYSNNAFPVNLKEEAEGCDSFSGAASLPGKPNPYRNGSIAIEDTADVYGGYDVCRGQKGETLTWQEVPLEGTVHLLVRAAADSAGGRMHFVIDGVAHSSVRVPKTGGGQTWTTVDMGAYSFAYSSYHTVSLVWDTSGISVNWWQVQTAQLPDGIYKIVAAQDKNTLTSRRAGALETAPYAGLPSQKWRLHALSKGRYTLRASSLNGAFLQTAIIPQSDGFCVIQSAQTAVWSPKSAGMEFYSRKMNCQEGIVKTGRFRDTITHDR